MAQATDYYQKNLKDIIGGTMPEFKRARGEQYNFLRNQALRTGQSAGSAAQAAKPFADAAGSAAAKAGVAARGMANQQEQFDTGQANWQKSFDKQSSQFDERMNQQDQQQNTANMMAMFEQTGWTPEMLEAMGYGDSKAGTASFNRQIKDLGFSNPGQNPGQKNVFGSGNSYPGQNQFYRNKAGSQFGGQTGLIYG